MFGFTHIWYIWWKKGPHTNCLFSFFFFFKQQFILFCHSWIACFISLLYFFLFCLWSVFFNTFFFFECCPFHFYYSMNCLFLLMATCKPFSVIWPSSVFWTTCAPNRFCWVVQDQWVVVSTVGCWTRKRQNKRKSRIYKNGKVSMCIFSLFLLPLQQIHHNKALWISLSNPQVNWLEHLILFLSLYSIHCQHRIVIHE